MAPSDFTDVVVEHPENCDGFGFVHEDRPGGQYRAGRCPGCEREELLKAARGFVPPRFRAPIDLPAAVADWVARGEDAEGLFLAGQVGTGKTHLAYHAAIAWCMETNTVPRGSVRPEEYLGGRRHGPTVEFIRATAFFDELRPGNDRHRQVVEDCQRARLLILDDVGAEKPSDWTVEKLYEVIDERYARQLPLVVTSNVPPGKLSGHVGERVASRFAEMCRVVAVTGTDRRRAAA